MPSDEERLLGDAAIEAIEQRVYGTVERGLMCLRGDHEMIEGWDAAAMMKLCEHCRNIYVART